MTSDQRRNVMASRKLAQQRVLRIMQEQSAGPTDRAPIEPATERQTAPRPANEATWHDGDEATKSDEVSA